MNHAFDDIEVKENAIELLENALCRKRIKCMIGTGSMSDPYMPLEQRLGMTRKALETAYRYGYGFTLITKSPSVLRDLDLLQAINKKAKCVVQMTLTAYDNALCKIIEPNVAPASERFAALKTLNTAGIPTVVWLSPILPFITDTKENIEGILNYCIEARIRGIICFGMGLTLRKGNREYFYEKLDAHFPGVKEKYIKHFGTNYILISPHNAGLMSVFRSICENRGIEHDTRKIFKYLNTLETVQKPSQLELFR